jgi:hypothetical protein
MATALRKRMEATAKKRLSVLQDQEAVRRASICQAPAFADENAGALQQLPRRRGGGGGLAAKPLAAAAGSGGSTLKEILQRVRRRTTTPRACATGWLAPVCLARVRH